MKYFKNCIQWYKWLTETLTCTYLSLDAYIRLQSDFIFQSYSRRRKILFNYSIKMKITCVIAIIMSFLVWENAAMVCFGKTKNQCSEARANGCDWHTDGPFIGRCYRIEDADKIFLNGAGFSGGKPGKKVGFK